jgi:flagellin
MSLRVNTNIAAINAHRNLVASGVSLGKSIEKLSSGLRINRAADDAAGLSISEKLRAQIRGVQQAQRNAQDAISMIQTAEGALTEVHSMLQRMRELALQAANDTLSADDRAAINSEIQELADEIDAISDRTKFNGKNLLDGNLATKLDATSGVEAGFVVNATSNTSVTAVDVSGAEANETYTFADTATGLELSYVDANGVTHREEIADADLAVGADGTLTLNYASLGIKVTLSSVAGETAANVAAGLNTRTIVTAATSSSANFQIGADVGDDYDVAFREVKITGATAAEMSTLGTELNDFNTTQDVANAEALVTALDDAIGYVSEVRGDLGAAQNRLEHAVNSLGVSEENLSASESRIRDVDMAAEMANFTKFQILQQSGMAILAQANAAPQNVLALLR